MNVSPLSVKRGDWILWQVISNPYGDGRAAPRIVRVLREVPLDARLIQKRLA